MKWFIRNILPTILVCIACSIYIGFEYNLFPYTINNDVEKKFYVINMDRNQSRWQDVSEQAEKYNLNLERFAAIDGYELILEDIKSGEKFTGKDLADSKKSLIQGRKYKVFCNQNEDPEYIYDTQYVGKAGVYMLSIGEIGLICSSRHLWRKIANEPIEHMAIIFEDDIELYKDFDQNVQNIFAHLPKSWDIIYLDAAFNSFPKKFVPENEYIYKVVFQVTTWRTHAYMINQRTARKLLNKYDDFNFLAVDQFLGYMKKYHGWKTFLSRLKIADVRSIKSEIEVMGRSVPPRKKSGE